MTDTDRPVYVAVRYVYHDGSTAEPAPGTMTPKEIVDRAMHPSVASTTIWCPGVANPEPDADVHPILGNETRPVRRGITTMYGNVHHLTAGQLQQRWDDHYRRGMDDDYPEGGDVA